jgi:succinate dehydrogenase/fumarate reductase iron-sulfur protein
VWRWEAGRRERVEAFEVEARPGTTVLDALVEIQRERDPTLAFRYACRVGMCGSCAMVVNGRERWACRTLLAPLGARVTVRPLYHFPLVRDLVVDMAPFVARMQAVGAHFVPEAGGGARVGAAAPERSRIDAAIECIGCGACLSACSIAGLDPGFAGPAALNRAYTLQVDARDGGRARRWPLLLGEDALLRCHGQATCTEVCPMELSPTDSILRLRRKAIFQALSPRPPLDTRRKRVVA